MVIISINRRKHNKLDLHQNEYNNTVPDVWDIEILATYQKHYDKHKYLSTINLYG